MKRQNKIVQEIKQNIADVFTYAIITIKHGFSMHKHSPGPLGGVENHSLWPGFSTPSSGPGEC